MRILLTRPHAQAEEMAPELRAMGHEVIISPLLERQILEISENLESAGALVFTSLNGVGAMAGRTPEALLSRPVFAVGARTAAAAEKAGFQRLVVGMGTANDLVPLIIGFEGEIDGPIVHVSGEDARTDVTALLKAENQQAARVPAYRMKVARGLSGEASGALANGDLGAALFFSPRSAELFVTLLKAEGLASGIGGVVAVALSEAVAKPLNQLDWADIRIAAQPTRRAMFELL